MVVLDTCALIYDALDPGRLGQAARQALADGEKSGTLACSDTSLWEIAMLVEKGRLEPGAPTREFLELIVQARSLTVLPVTAGIAALAAGSRFDHGDPADRLIGATALLHAAPLLTCDARLKAIEGLQLVW